MFMKIELPANGLESVWRQIDQELVNGLHAKRKKDKDIFLARAIGAVGAAYRLTTTSEEEPENTELAFHGNYDEG